MRLILFDVDGTLINSAGAGRRAMERGFSEIYGIENGFEGVQFHGKAGSIHLYSSGLFRIESLRPNGFV